jgi:hypothetical protein
VGVKGKEGCRPHIAVPVIASIGGSPTSAQCRTDQADAVFHSHQCRAPENWEYSDIDTDSQILVTS